MATTTTTTNKEAKLVIVDWNDLLIDASGDRSSTILHGQIEEAYGASGMGILAIRNVPNFVATKDRVLRFAHALATLPNEYLENELADPKTLYNAGWSHGKEKMGDEPDTAKASYYYNPITDEPGTAQDRLDYPLSYPCNKWPDEDLYNLPGFRHCCCDLGKILTDACIVLSRHLDSYVAAVVTERNGTGANRSRPAANLLQTALTGTEKVKARLLYYYPLATKSSSEDSWIGWHNDSGFLTALAGDLYLDHQTGAPLLPLGTCPDPEAGLYVVVARGGGGGGNDNSTAVQKVTIPPDCLAIQVGECTQIVTHGVLRATPHCVRGAPDLARASLACFVDVPPQFPLVGDGDSAIAVAAHSSDHRVPPLQDRWRSGMTFGDFLTTTFQKYYEWNTTVAQPP